MLVLWSCNAPIFFPQVLPFATSYLPTSTKFFCVLYWKYSPTKPKYNNYSKRFALNQLKVELYALMDKRNLHSALCYFTCMYCPKLVIHSNQIKLSMASSVDYIISWMFLPFCKVLFSCTGTQNVKKQSTYKLQNSIPLHYVNIIMTESIRPLWEIMLMFFQFLKSSGYMCNLCCQNETSITKFGQ